MPDSDEVYELREARLDRRERDLLQRVEVILSRVETAIGLPPIDAGRARPALTLVGERTDEGVIPSP